MSGKKIASENGSYKNFSGLIFCRGAEIKVKGADFILCYDYSCMNGGSVIDGIVSSASIANSVWLNGICDFGFFRKVDWRNGVWKNGEFLYSKWKKERFLVAILKTVFGMMASLSVVVSLIAIGMTAYGWADSGFVVLGKPVLIEMA